MADLYVIIYLALKTWMFATESSCAGVRTHAALAGEDTLKPRGLRDPFQTENESHVFRQCSKLR